MSPSMYLSDSAGIWSSPVGLPGAVLCTASPTSELPVNKLKNYRPIALLNAAQKNWEKVLKQRMPKLIQ